MAKKRRVSASENRTIDKFPDKFEKSGSFIYHRRILYQFFILIFLPGLLLAVYRIKYSPKNASKILSVYERGLVRENINYEEILSENSRVSENTSVRYFENNVLAYVTPWNSKGYEMAIKFRSKLTHISPVWYEIKSEGNKIVLHGRHNADFAWISQLRLSGHSLILPRVVLEVFPNEMLGKKKQIEKVIKLIVTECKEMGYDGIVLESWSRWAAYGVLNDPDMRKMAMRFIERLGSALHAVDPDRDELNHLQLIYVIPSPRSETTLNADDFGPQDLQDLYSAVDGFSLMTYDFSGPQNPGPNAPLTWIRSSLNTLLGNKDIGINDHSLKLFLGINFYGNDFFLSEGSRGEAIIGGGYLSLLNKHKPIIQWHEKSSEHFFIYSYKNAKHAVFYPTLMSISARLKEACEWGVSLSIWEIGQGLDYFFELL